MSRYYIIWREGSGAGFFSIISSVLGHIQFAEKNNLYPIIDMVNHPNTYTESEVVHGTKNSFEYYFKSINPMPLEEIYKTEEFVLSGGNYPADFTMSISTESTLLLLWKKYFALNEFTSKHVSESRNRVRVDTRTLGIHFRGQEMRRAASHPLPLTLKQAIAVTMEVMETGQYDKIFVVTEGSNYLRTFKSAFPGKVVSTNAFRSYVWNSYKFKWRKLHHYKLGLEILTDTILLSECGGLISGSSNVSEMAILLNNGEYIQNIQIRNGKNSSNRFFAKINWYVKYLLPSKFGGLPKSNIVT